MAFWIPMAIGAGMGLLKSQQGAKAAEKQNKFREAALRYSPWTGMGDPGGATAPDPLSSMLQGAGGGALMGNALGMKIPGFGGGDSGDSGGAGGGDGGVNLSSKSTEGSAGAIGSTGGSQKVSSLGVMPWDEQFMGPMQAAAWQGPPWTQMLQYGRPVEGV